MRHRVKGRKLNRTASHRLATLRSLATALFLHKKIKTTVAKAKTARLLVEPLITKAKKGSVHAHRLVARHINDRDAMKELFGPIVEKIGDRPGGYTRVVKLGQRLGDGAEMAILELVDFGEVVGGKSKKQAKKKVKKAVDEKAVVNADNVSDAEIVEETVVDEAKAEKDEVKSEEVTAEKTVKVETEVTTEDKPAEDKAANEISTEDKKSEDK